MLCNTLGVGMGTLEMTDGSATAARPSLDSICAFIANAIWSIAGQKGIAMSESTELKLPQELADPEQLSVPLPDPAPRPD